MNTSEHVLVIILSATLALFLVLAIIIAIQIARLLRALNRVVQKAEAVVETAENVSRVFKNATGPLAVARLISNIVDGVKQHTKDTRSKG